jgi:hypothetical protein
MLDIDLTKVSMWDWFKICFKFIPMFAIAQIVWIAIITIFVLGISMLFGLNMDSYQFKHKVHYENIIQDYRR